MFGVLAFLKLGRGNTSSYDLPVGMIGWLGVGYRSRVHGVFAKRDKDMKIVVVMNLLHPNSVSSAGIAGMRKILTVLFDII